MSGRRSSKLRFLSPHLAPFANATGGCVNMHFGEDVPQRPSKSVEVGAEGVHNCMVI